MGLLSWSGDIKDGYVCNAAVTSRRFLIEMAPLKAGIDLHERRHISLREEFKTPFWEKGKSLCSLF